MERAAQIRIGLEDPDRQLLLVSGDTLWHYDIDLETATRRNTGDDSSFAPLELLGGDPATLRERFATEVKINHSAKKGKIELTYYGNDDLQRVLDLLGIQL